MLNIGIKHYNPNPPKLGPNVTEILLNMVLIPTEPRRPYCDLPLGSPAFQLV